MKKEELEKLGLSEEQIREIHAMNGRDIEAVKAKLTAAEAERDEFKGQLAATKEALAAFDGVDVGDLRGQIDQLQGKIKAMEDEYAAKEAARAFDDTLAGAIKAAGGRNTKAIKAMLDVDTLRASKDQSVDIKAAIDAVKESDAYLFGADEPHKNAVSPTGGGGGSDSSTLSAIRAAMGLK